MEEGKLEVLEEDEHHNYGPRQWNAQTTQYYFQREELSNCNKIQL
jgi:hypothetical protein